jgi:hypothetical protein
MNPVGSYLFPGYKNFAITPATRHKANYDGPNNTDCDLYLLFALRVGPRYAV